ncbi:cytochrome P450 4V2-like [Ornithodoros turicata]|uniref:cytochrome P450 4V2-like n=1 Tax=Ornithodoros turicata TaxID=34597 RepID=UPI0031396C0C
MRIVDMESAYSRWLPTHMLSTFVYGTILVALALHPVIKWIRVWNALRCFPGPSRIIPFWFCLSVWWSKRRTKYSDIPSEFFTVIRDLSSAQTHRNFVGYLGIAPVVVLQTPDAAEALLASRLNNRKPFVYKFLEPALGSRNMLTSSGEIWSKKRRLIAPSFHRKNSESFLMCFNKEANCLMERIEKRLDDSPSVPISQYIRHSTVQSIFAAAMGVTLDDATAQQYSRCMHLVEYNFIVRAFRPWTWYQPLYDVTREGTWFKNEFRKLFDTCCQVLERRRWLNAQEHTLGHPVTAESTHHRKCHRTCLDVLLEKHHEDPDYSEQEIMEDMNLMIGAGYETTTSAAVHCLYLICLSSQIQQKVHEEQDRIFADDINRDVTAEDIDNMEYLSCCLKETFRLLPPLPYIARVLDHEIVIDGNVIPKGVTCAVDIFGIHRNPAWFQDPQEFIPERFMHDAEKEWHPYSYIPFSAGPRKCIGQEFSSVQIKVILSKLFRRFTFEPQKPIEKTDFKFEVVLKVKDGIYLWTSRRQPEGTRTQQKGG